jgi:hypothetical protein
MKADNNVLYVNSKKEYTNTDSTIGSIHAFTSLNAPRPLIAPPVKSVRTPKNVSLWHVPKTSTVPRPCKPVVLVAACPAREHPTGNTVSVNIRTRDFVVPASALTVRMEVFSNLFYSKSKERPPPWAPRRRHRGPPLKYHRRSCRFFTPFKKCTLCKVQFQTLNDHGSSKKCSIRT